jgi:hypothetical protein
VSDCAVILDGAEKGWIPIALTLAAAWLPGNAAVNKVRIAPLEQKSAGSQSCRARSRPGLLAFGNLRRLAMSRCGSHCDPISASPLNVAYPHLKNIAASLLDLRQVL